MKARKRLHKDEIALPCNITLLLCEKSPHHWLLNASGLPVRFRRKLWWAVPAHEQVCLFAFFPIPTAFPEATNNTHKFIPKRSPQVAPSKQWWRHCQLCSLPSAAEGAMSEREKETGKKGSDVNREFSFRDSRRCCCCAISVAYASGTPTTPGIASYCNAAKWNHIARSIQRLAALLVLVVHRCRQSRVEFHKVALHQRRPS